VAAVLALSACSSPQDAAPPETSVGPAVSEPATAAGGRQPWGGFPEATLEVRTPDSFFEWCVLVAATEAARQRGLMDAPGPELGGYDGMLFVFDGDTTGGFWMQDTEVPLTIAYLDGDGRLVSTADMDPCPPGSDRCPAYAPDGPYRTALEVPQGGLAALGVDADSQAVLTDRACSPV